MLCVLVDSSIRNMLGAGTLMKAFSLLCRTGGIPGRSQVVFLQVNQKEWNSMRASRRTTKIAEERLQELFRWLMVDGKR